MKLRVFKKSLDAAKLDGRAAIAEAVLAAGEVFPDGVLIEHDVLAAILKAHAPHIVLGQRIIPHTPTGVELLVASRAAVCAACQWNMDELCQHPDCQTCPGKQKRTGKLAAMISQPNAKCPLKKWK